ncbi:MAG: hypothetical protein LBT00_09855, partial [Spirochaetaceae bacterium]|nr:hypothetical protein [Spirochaetaceae bacterium]
QSWSFGKVGRRQTTVCPPRPKLQKRAKPATESQRRLASRRVFEQALIDNVSMCRSRTAYGRLSAWIALPNGTITIGG